MKNKKEIKSESIMIDEILEDFGKKENNPHKPKVKSNNHFSIVLKEILKEYKDVRNSPFS